MWRSELLAKSIIYRGPNAFFTLDKIDTKSWWVESELRVQATKLLEQISEKEAKNVEDMATKLQVTPPATFESVNKEVIALARKIGTDENAVRTMSVDDIEKAKVAAWVTKLGKSEDAVRNMKVDEINQEVEILAKKLKISVNLAPPDHVQKKVTEEALNIGMTESDFRKADTVTIQEMQVARKKQRK